MAPPTEEKGVYEAKAKEEDADYKVRLAEYNKKKASSGA